MSDLILPYSTTGIGSLPHKSPQEACELVLRTFDIPFWPQLPAVSFKESMVAQYSEGFPFINTIDDTGDVWVIRDDSDELERFYESCGEDAKIAISEDYAAGLHSFLKLIKHRRFKMLKGHITGPLTFTLGLKDNFGRMIYFDEELREISLMLLKAKMRWQVDLLKQHSDNVLIFIDEPILSSIGSSSYLGVDSHEVLRLLTEIVSAIKNAGALSGIHCCGRGDWGLIMQTGVDVLSFDAFEYFDAFVIYHETLKEFLARGGYLAWGIVPTSDVINSVDDKQLASLFIRNMEKITGYMPEELVRSRTLLTPSCGTGSRSIEETIKIFQMLIRLKEAVG
jgi:hypothetical protein